MAKNPRSNVKKKRLKEGRDPTPSYGLIDPQSVKTIYASEGRGYDGNKKVKGRKRHIVSGTMGNLLAVKVHAANISDTTAGIGPAVQAYEKYPTIKKFCGDKGYRGTFVIDVFWGFALDVDISERVTPKFEVLPKRWVIERTFAWLNNYRRLSKDYEIAVESAEAMIVIASLHSLLKSLA